MSDNKRKFVYSVFWNCGLIIVGSVIQTIVLKGIAAPHQFIPGGLFGIASLLHYLTHWLNPGLLYLLLNIPMFILGYLFVSRRFLWYSGLSMLVVSLTYQFINIPIQIENQLYAAIAFGAGPWCRQWYRSAFIWVKWWCGCSGNHSLSEIQSGNW